jgi:DNA polymerase-3 subunit alpha
MYTNYLEKGMIVLVDGGFKQRYNSDQYEFRLGKIHLLETVKPALTRQVLLEVEPQFINEDFVNFIENNVKHHPGKASLRFNIIDSRNKLNIGMYVSEKGFTMNDDMVVFLNNNPDVGVKVSLL